MNYPPNIAIQNLIDQRRTILRIPRVRAITQDGIHHNIEDTHIPVQDTPLSRHGTVHWTDIRQASGGIEQSMYTLTF